MHYQPLSLISFALLCILASSHEHNGYKCTHDTLEQSYESMDVEEFHSSLKDQRILAEYPQIRMIPNFDALSNAPESFKSYIMTQLVPAVLDYFQAALKIKYPMTKNITLSASTQSVCGIPTPAILKKGGVAGDYFILFDSGYDEDVNWVAESYACYLSSATKRPYIAKTVFNRALLQDGTNDVLLHEKNIYLLSHELIHTLGFSKSLYKYFLDSNGNVMKNHIRTVNDNGIDRLVLDVPFLTEKARKYFGCPTLEGIYLENDGGDSSYGSHLERRQFFMEHMSSGLLHTQRISEFSLGLLEATGWYIPDYNFADPYFFGRGKGCGFFKDQCSNTNFDYETYGYCIGSSFGCGVHGRGGGLCVSDPKSDSCKYFKPSLNHDCENPDAADFTRLADIQAFGRYAGSKCFTGTLSSDSSTASTTSFCFTYDCMGSGLNVKLQVKVGKKIVTCAREGPISVSGYKGIINCPDPLAFCSMIGKPYCSRNCMGRGVCVDGKCQCKPGYKGTDCAIAI